MMEALHDKMRTEAGSEWSRKIAESAGRFKTNAVFLCYTNLTLHMPFGVR